MFVFICVAEKRRPKAGAVLQDSGHLLRTVHPCGETFPAGHAHQVLAHNQPDCICAASRHESRGRVSTAVGMQQQS